MARQIIILDVQKGGDGITQVNCVMWFPIAAPTARVPLPSNSFRSDVLAGLPSAVTAPERTALVDGSVLEVGVSASFAASTTTAQIQAELVREYASRATAIAALPPTRQFFGIAYDGTAWA